eukprot:2695060-Pyramimonas_sp.AAC.1
MRPSSSQAAARRCTSSWSGRAATSDDVAGMPSSAARGLAPALGYTSGPYLSSTCFTADGAMSH